MESSLNTMSAIEQADAPPAQPLAPGLGSSMDIPNLWSFRKQVASTRGTDCVTETKPNKHREGFADNRLSVARSGARALADVREEPNLESSADLQSTVFPFPMDCSNTA